MARMEDSAPIEAGETGQTAQTTQPAAPREAKQVIVMRKDLNMRKGKMIAQGAHASLKVLLDRRRGGVEDTCVLELTPAMAAWIAGRFTKVCVSVGSEAELDEIHRRAT